MKNENSNTPAHPGLIKHYKRSKTIRRRNPALRRLIRFWPLLAWMAAAGIVMLIHVKGTQFGGMTGAVETTEELVAPLRPDRLMSINVTVGQHVSAGDVIAQMDTSILEAKKTEILAEQQEARNSITGYQQDILSLSQQFNAAIKNAEAEIIKIEAEKASIAAELTELKKEQQRREKLAAQNIISIQDLSELRPKIAGIEQRLESYPKLLEVHQRRLSEVTAELDSFKHWLRLENREDISKAIQAKMTSHNKIIDAKLDMLNLQISNCTLRSTRAGSVARIEATPGDIIQAGQEVVRIVSEESTRVIGFLPEVFLGNVQKGDKAVIWRERDGCQMDAVVESIAPDVRTLPGRISPMSAQAIRGRRIVLLISGDHQLIPGETVKIHPQRKPLIDFKKIFGSAK